MPPLARSPATSDGQPDLLRALISHLMRIPIRIADASDDHLVDEHAPRVAIAVVIDVGYLRIAFQLGIPQLPPVCEGKTVPHVQPYSCMYVCTTLVWLSMGDARVFLCSMPFRASSYASDHG